MIKQAIAIRKEKKLMLQQISTKQNSLAQQHLLLETEKSLDRQEEIEFLRELVESLKLELSDTTERLQEIEEELKDTNEELGNALIPSEHLTFDEAKKLAQKLVASQKPTKECLAELLSAIYDSPVESGVLAPSQGRSPQKINDSPKPEIKSFSPENNLVQHELDKLEARFGEHQLLVTKLAIQCNKLRNNLYTMIEIEKK